MKIEVTPEDFAAIVEGFRHNPHDIFLATHARHIVGVRRYLQAKAEGKVHVSSDLDHLFGDALEHNIKGMDDFGAGPRTNRLIRPLYAIDRVFFGAKDLKALCVGPRTEMELLSLVAQGFLPENVRGLDLFTYTPWIETGNMHNMQYRDNSFDVLIAGWVLTYSSDPELACREFLRVVKDRGIIAIGSTYLSPRLAAERGAGRSEIHYPRVADLLKRFGSAVRNVYVSHDSEPEFEEGRTIVIFDVRK
jgi:SAM-dependent methyltransferase